VIFQRAIIKILSKKPYEKSITRILLQEDPYLPGEVCFPAPKQGSHQTQLWDTVHGSPLIIVILISFQTLVDGVGVRLLDQVVRVPHRGDLVIRRLGETQRYSMDCPRDGQV
jgi:hypothetical protein